MSSSWATVNLTILQFQTTSATHLFATRAHVGLAPFTVDSQHTDYPALGLGGAAIGQVPQHVQTRGKAETHRQLGIRESLVFARIVLDRLAVGAGWRATIQVFCDVLVAIGAVPILPARSPAPAGVSGMWWTCP